MTGSEFFHEIARLLRFTEVKVVFDKDFTLAEICFIEDPSNDFCEQRVFVYKKTNGFRNTLFSITGIHRSNREALDEIGNNLMNLDMSSCIEHFYLKSLYTQDEIELLSPAHSLDDMVTILKVKRDLGEI